MRGLSKEWLTSSRRNRYTTTCGGRRREFHIDHQALWNHLRQYLAPFGRERLDAVTRDTIDAIREIQQPFSGPFPRRSLSGTGPRPVSPYVRGGGIAGNSASGPTSAVKAPWKRRSTTLFRNPSIRALLAIRSWIREPGRPSGGKSTPARAEAKTIPARNREASSDRPQEPQSLEGRRARTDEILMPQGIPYCCFQPPRWHDIDKCGQWDFHEFLVKSSNSRRLRSAARLERPETSERDDPLRGCLGASE